MTPISAARWQQGWLGLALPAEYGGAGRSAFARFVLVEELIAAGAPVSAHWFADRQTSPLILKFGTPAQREYFVPRMVRGEIFMCIGMSEPDTASTFQRARRARAHRDGLAPERPQDLDDQCAPHAVHVRAAVLGPARRSPQGAVAGAD
ncbi:acyl-CoA dehydrogenase family protein [Cupriavidus basilensis]